MQVKNLKNVALDRIVDCLNASFDGYFVPMPRETAFWRNKFYHAGVDKSRSWGAFEDNKLVGFVINAMGYDQGQWTAFNTGTGVLPKFRGRQLVDKMYEYGRRELRKTGVQKCTLEVIDRNERAIKVYRRIGFAFKRNLLCFKGILLDNGKSRVQPIRLEDVAHCDSDHNYSWDNRWDVVKRAGSTYQTYRVFEPDEKTSRGYFIINPESGYIAQLESKSQEWTSVFSGIAQIHKEVRINNIGEDRISLISHLKKIHFENTIKQIEMEMYLE